MTNNNQVNWDEIPEDVEVVVTFKHLQPTYLKHVNGSLYQQGHRDNKYMHCDIELGTLREELGDQFHLRPSPITEPTPEVTESTQVESSEVEATTTPEFDWSSVVDDVEGLDVKEAVTPEVDIYEIFKESIRGYKIPPTRTAESTAVATLEQLGYEWEGGELWKPPLGKKPDFTPPSIHTILQEAKQSILKHHGVTGKVKFTVTCS